MRARVRIIAEMRLPAARTLRKGCSRGQLSPYSAGDIATARLQILTRLAGRSHRVLREYNSVPLVAPEVGPDALTELEASSLWVKHVVEDKLNAPSLAQSVPLIGGDQAWNRGFDGTGMVVAIIDTGVN